MMPGADFQACLETPHLSKASAAADSIARDIAQAQELLSMAAEKYKASSAAGSSGDPADISLLSYRAMYSAAKALVHHGGYQFSNFSCLIAALNELFVSNNKLDKNLVDQLLASQALRGEAADHVKAAKVFVAKSKDITGGPAR